MSLTRRKFLQGVATTSAVTVIGPSLLTQLAHATVQDGAPAQE